MALKQQIIFDKCLFKTKSKEIGLPEPELSVGVTTESIENAQLEKDVDKGILPITFETDKTDSDITNDSAVTIPEENDLDNLVTDTSSETVVQPKKKSNDLEEIEIHLEELKESEPVQIKQRNEVYYEMYREARKKAKIARDLALAAYLEAKQIKNTYMLTDLNSDSDSDNGSLDNDNIENENILEDDIEELYEPSEKIKIEV
jgi:hypothetical protein